MPLPSSGPLSLTDIQTEFGGANPIGLNEYYAGGGLVPAGTTGTNGAVPSSGAISIFNFYGTSNVIPYWTASYAGSNGPNYFTTGAIAGPTGIYAVGQGAGGPQSVVILKFNLSNSNLIWGKIGTPLSSMTVNPTIALDASENLFVFVQGSNNQQTYVYKFDSAGNLLWQRLNNNLGTFGSYYALPTVDGNGNAIYGSAYYSGGVYYGAIYKVSPAGSLLWSRRMINSQAPGGFSPSQITVDSSNNIYIAGTFNGFNQYGNRKASIIKLDSNGDLLNGVTFDIESQSQNSGGYGVAVDSSGNIYAYIPRNSGAFNNRNYIIKLNSSFTKLWERRGDGLDGNYGLFLTTDGKLIFQSQMWLYSQGTRSTFSALDTSGNLLFSNMFSAGQSFASTSSSNMFIGTSSSTNTIVKFPQISANGYYPLYTATDGLYVSYPGQTFSTTTGVNFGGAGVITSSVLSDAYTTPTTTWSPITTNFAVTSNVITTFGGSSGSAAFTVPGTYTWIVPAGVTSISVLVVGGGAGGSAQGGYSGSGGGLAYVNNITVTPGASYSLRVGYFGLGGDPNASPYAGSDGEGSYFGADLVKVGPASATGGTPGTPIVGTGGTGGNGRLGGTGSGGAGAGGYFGTGGFGGPPNGPGTNATGGGGGGGGGGALTGSFPNDIQYTGAQGGSVGIIGLGTSGIGGGVNTAGGGGSYPFFSSGGGGGSGGYQNSLCCVCPCFYNTYYFAGGNGKQGLVRIIWPGNTRSFPSTNVATP